MGIGKQKLEIGNSGDKRVLSYAWSSDSTAGLNFDQEMIYSVFMRKMVGIVCQSRP